MWQNIPIAENRKGFFIRVAKTPDDFWGYHVTHWYSNFVAESVDFLTRDEAVVAARDEIDEFVDCISEELGPR